MTRIDMIASFCIIGVFQKSNFFVMLKRSLAGLYRQYFSVKSSRTNFNFRKTWNFLVKLQTVKKSQSNLFVMLKKSLAGLYRQLFSVKSLSTNLNFRKLSRRVNMVKDIFIVDTRCHLNKSISKAFTKLGYEAKVSRISPLHLPFYFRI